MVPVSMINWEVVFGLGMIHSVQTGLGEGMHSLILRVFLISPSLAFSCKVCQGLQVVVQEKMKGGVWDRRK